MGRRWPCAATSSGYLRPIVKLTGAVGNSDGLTLRGGLSRPPLTGGRHDDRRLATPAPAAPRAAPGRSFGLGRLQRPRGADRDRFARADHPLHERVVAEEDVARAMLRPALLEAHRSGVDEPLQDRVEVIALGAGEQLRHERGVRPIALLGTVGDGLGEVEQQDHRRAGAPAVLDERMALLQPAHRDLPPLATDLLGDDRAALLGDREERLEPRAALTATLHDAGLVRARKRIEHGLDDGDAPLVLAEHGVDAAQQSHELEDRLGDERRTEVQLEVLLPLRPRASDAPREQVALRDAGVDERLEGLASLALALGDDARDELVARHSAVA